MKRLLILPAIVLIMLAIVLPTFAVVNYSFQLPYASENKFVGLEHFREIFHDSRWWAAFGRNLAFTAIVLAIEILLGLGLALLLYRGGKLYGLISTIIVIPALLPWITIGLMWRLMCRSTGVLTSFIVNFLHFEYIPFRDPTQAFWTIVAMDVWHWTSLVFIVLSAGLASMETAPILAARTEGATRWQIFRHIELPALGFPLTFVALMRFMDSFKVYDEPLILFGGGPGLTTEFLSLYVKKIGLDQWLLGYGGALSLVYLLVVLILCFVMLTVMTRGKGLI